MQPKITAPHISKSTMKSMWEFFSKTSIPRMLEAERKEVNQKCQ